MASDRQIAANRSNARKSTGPRSKKGQEASSRNARRHGLAIAVGCDPALQGEIEKLARLLSTSGSQDVSGPAREAAEAEFELLRIRTVRAWLFQTLYFAKANAPDGLAELNGKLGKLERYERRAFSRRKSALRAMSQAAAI
ncbi:hypothetical protein SAMN05443247_05744 [Bradyrhizobium erythrophlei]|jgi:hypothetical protein|nr:hypothetical protein SAMN05443247_05744 [Bradyrhizobium erythrophlei]